MKTFDRPLVRRLLNQHKMLVLEQKSIEAKIQALSRALWASRKRADALIDRAEQLERERLLTGASPAPSPLSRKRSERITPSDLAAAGLPEDLINSMF